MHCVSDRKLQAAKFVRHFDSDLTISAANRHVLDKATLANPALGCINFHNGPLPDYAGFRATALAIYNGELSPGVTWHRIDAGSDTGPVLCRRSFLLDTGETTASLNTRCTIEAIDCLEDLLDKIDRNDLG